MKLNFFFWKQKKCLRRPKQILGARQQSLKSASEVFLLFSETNESLWLLSEAFSYLFRVFENAFSQMPHQSSWVEIRIRASQWKSFFFGLCVKSLTRLPAICPQATLFLGLPRKETTNQLWWKKWELKRNFFFLLQET